MKETLLTRHRNHEEPMMIANDRKPTLKALHTDAVNKAAVNSHERNVVLDDPSPPINNPEKDLTGRNARLFPN